MIGLGHFIVALVVIAFGVGYWLLLYYIASELRRIRRALEEWKSERKW